MLAHNMMIASIDRRRTRELADEHCRAELIPNAAFDPCAASIARRSGECTASVIWMIAHIGLRSVAVCGWFVVLGCSDAPRVRGVVMLTRWQVREPAASVDVYALPARNQIDRELAELCANDSLLNEIGGLEMPIGPVRVNAEGIELDASLQRPRSDERPDAAAVKLTPWARRDVYLAFHARMDSLLRRRAIASARTNETGLYQMPLPSRDSIELFAFTIFDDGGALLIWRDRVSGDGTHDLPNPIRHMHHVYCGEP